MKSWIRCTLPVLALLFSGPLAAVTELLYDTEPNDAPHEAVTLSLPSGKNSVRIIGELRGNEQDAYRFVVDEDLAGRRFDLQLNGRGGALTRADLFDFTELADGRGRIPAALERRPDRLMTLKTDDGSRPVRVDALLLAPGVYILGVSHSGGEGSYTVEVSQHDDGRVAMAGDDNSADSPDSVSTRGRTVVWTQGETWFEFEIGDDQAEQSWDLEFQTPLGHAATARLLDPEDAELLALETGDGVAARRPGLTFPPGRYRIQTDQKAAGVQMFSIETGASPPLDGREVEPNDRNPNPVELGDPLAGRFDDGDRDWLAFEVAEDDAGRIFDLELAVEAGAQTEVCLIRQSIDLSHCVRGADGLTALRDLGFIEGRYQLRMHDRKRTGTDWQLNWVERGRAGPGEEVEPNNDYRHAVALHERGFGRGRFVGREVDHWRFSVSGEPELWRLQMQGDDLFELTLNNSAGKSIVAERAGNNRRVRLDNVFLIPGEYVLAARGTDSDYVLRTVPLGPPPEGMEMEPNDDVANAGRLRFGVEHFGTLAEKGDTDRYRFTLAGHERIRLTVQPPVDGSIRGVLGAGDEARAISDIRNRNNPGEALQWDRYLPPADYILALTPNKVSDAEYTVVMERLDFLDRVADREPNDDRAEAAPFPADGRVTGAVGMAAGRDWYALPAQDQPAIVELTDHDGIRIQLYSEADPETDLLEHDRENDVYRAELAPDQGHWLFVRGNGDYHYDLSALGDVSGADNELPLAVDMTFDHDRIEAFSPWSQQIDGELTITNPSARTREVNLETHGTDARWRMDHASGPFALGPEQSTTIRLNLYVPPDRPAIPTTRLSVRAHDRYGQGKAASEIIADAGTPPVRPEFHWPVPEALRGGINAAALAFGAEPVAGPNMDDRELEESESLYDGLARVGGGTGFRIQIRRRTPDELPQPTVRLAGDEPVPVAGFLINPTAARFTTQGIPREFAVALSPDGERFETVLTGRLEPIAEEQAFILDEPVKARYARLMPGAPHFSSTNYGNMHLGEFKVVAEPDWRPRADAFNLAEPDLGGHLVWVDPPIRRSAFEQRPLRADSQAPEVRLAGETRTTVVLGFHHTRSALIDSIAIMPLVDGHGDHQPKSVSVAVADNSPVGPWQPITESELGVEEARIKFDEPVWARYVRLRFDALEGASRLQLPDRIAVYESAGESILGEWGHYADIGPHEARDVPEWTGLPAAPDNISRDTAVRIGPGEPAPGRALLDTFSAWYRLEAPADNNHLILRLAAIPSVEAKPRMVDAAGNPIELYALEQTATEHQWEAYVDPGKRYWVEVVEPPRSVIFSWDTSASVATYLPTISNALLTYAETIKPGRDEVNLLPFGRKRPLLKNWQGHSYPLMKMLSAYPHESNSSDAEGTLAVAAREMIDRPGKKAVLLLTDAATITDGSLWPALHEGQPQVFAMKLSSVGAFGGDPFIELDLMQDWAKVRGGHFEYVTSFGVLAHGFDQAVGRLKAPVDFSIQADFDQVDDPAPAAIAVVSGEAGTDPLSRGAVEIILDASGSMLKRMGGERRIDIARAAIRRTVEETLPEGIPLALRVYGHREAGSCRTDLEIPLQPLDKTAFLNQIENIEAINLARTPIAESLAAVASDLNDTEGRRMVVLLTDGEETCDGDPAAEIEHLRESGFDVNINIVGFAIDDDDLKREFADWAALGGGDYLDADQAESLGEAMTRALQIPFQVIDSEGESIARGLVDGKTVEVPPGAYQVVVDTASTTEFHNLSVAPGEVLELALGNY